MVKFSLSRVSKFLSLAVVAVGLPLLLAACDQSLPPQVVELGCPVQNPAEMQRIFQGVNGVDGLSRPLNDHLVPVDVDGNCLSTAPVPEVFSAPVSQAYVTVLYSRYHYSYVYNPAIVVVPVRPGIVYRQGVAPTGRVVVQTARPAGATVVSPGAAGTVRPGATVATPPATVAPGSNNVVRPGVTTAPAAQTAPTAVTPSRPDAGTGSAFNRPTTQTAPTAVVPSRPAPSAPSSFSRPSAPSSSGRR
jgi:hypothetical protein